MATGAKARDGHEAGKGVPGELGLPDPGLPAQQLLLPGSWTRWPGLEGGAQASGWDLAYLWVSAAHRPVATGRLARQRKAGPSAHGRVGAAGESLSEETAYHQQRP